MFFLCFKTLKGLNSKYKILNAKNCIYFFDIKTTFVKLPKSMLSLKLSVDDLVDHTFFSSFLWHAYSMKGCNSFLKLILHMFKDELYMCKKIIIVWKVLSTVLVLLVSTDWTPCEGKFWKFDFKLKKGLGIKRYFDHTQI